MHDYNVMCINAFNGHLHQPQEETGTVNSHVYFRHREPKNANIPLSVL